jgi:hypothetical protein
MTPDGINNGDELVSTLRPLQHPLESSVQGSVALCTQKGDRLYTLLGSTSFSTRQLVYRRHKGTGHAPCPGRLRIGAYETVPGPMINSGLGVN